MSRTRIYVPELRALAYFARASTPEMWDERWELPAEQLKARFDAGGKDTVFTPRVKAHLPAGSAVMDGGCGTGYIVKSLELAGFKAIGLDFAQSTLRLIQSVAPQLPLIGGDVRRLPLADGALDGMVSGGVIEHFWEGYDEILREMHRVIRPDGLAFVSFPAMSPLRSLKAFLRGFSRVKKAELDAKSGEFYQFALNWKRVAADFDRVGFELVSMQRINGLKGLSDETGPLRPLFRHLHRKRRPRILASLAHKLGTPLAGHLVILILRRR